MFKMTRLRELAEHSWYTDSGRGWVMQGLSSGMGNRFYFFPLRPGWLWNPPSFLFKGYWGSLLGVKWPGH